MGLDIKTLACNASCASCYENTIRHCGAGPQMDFERMIDTLKARIGDYPSSTPALHGGEPLLLGKRKAERILQVVYEAKEQTGIQTNGLLVDDEWIEIFLKYRTNIGVSLDGDTPLLNAGRGASQAQTDRVMASIRKMKMAGLSVSVISVLRKHNAAENRIGLFIDFLRRLADDCYIYYVRTNPGIAFTTETIETEQLGDAEMGLALCRIAEVCMSDKRFKWQPVRDVIEMMAGYQGRSTCNFAGCDVWHTESETPILADGSLGNCMKGGGALDGIANLRADNKTNVRSEALRQIDTDDGGCGGCQWWDFCHGGCPGAALNDDYRRKTRFCYAYQRLFAYVQKRMEGMMPSIQVGSDMPLQNLTADGTTWHKQYIRAVANKPATTPKTAGNENHADKHADSHGDRPHGDSNDAEWRRANPGWGR